MLLRQELQRCDAKRWILMIRNNFLVAATIVLSSTGGAAEWQGDSLGEYVQAGEHGGRPYFIQRDTGGSEKYFLHYISEKGYWFVSKSLADTNAFVRNFEDTLSPPRDNWIFWDGRKRKVNDASFTLEFTSLSPCKLVRVAGEGDVVKEHGSKLGDYRSA